MLLNTSDYSQHINLPPRQLRLMYRRGQLPAIMIGDGGRGRARLLFDVEACDAAIHAMAESQRAERAAAVAEEAGR